MPDERVPHNHSPEGPPTPNKEQQVISKSAHTDDTPTVLYLCCSLFFSFHPLLLTSAKKAMKRSRIVATALVLAVSFASAQKNETVPTASPNSTIVPTPAPNSTVPTVAPNSTVPTMAPNSTVPTMAPNSTVPTMAPNSTVPTAAPVDPPTPQPTKKYVPPVEPTAAPTSPVPPVPSPPRGTSFMKLVGRTIGWLIFLGLSVLVFGALMSNRYRIYYALRGVWYSFLRLNCTRWIIRKVRGGRGPSSNTSLNEIIFDQNDLNEGLLLNDNNQ